MSTKSLLAKQSTKADETTRRFVARTKRIYRDIEEYVSPNYFTVDLVNSPEVAAMTRSIPDLRVHSAHLKNGAGAWQFFEKNGSPHTPESPNERVEHFIAANFAYSKPLNLDDILKLMEFVADRRFVKPGFKTLISVAFSKKASQKRKWDSIFNDTLYREHDERLAYGLRTVYEYTALCLSEACPALEIRMLLGKEHVNSRGREVYLMHFELNKPSWSPDFPPPRSRLKQQDGGSFYIGGLRLPAD